MLSKLVFSTHLRHGCIQVRHTVHSICLVLQEGGTCTPSPHKAALTTGQNVPQKKHVQEKHSPRLFSQLIHAKNKRKGFLL